ncbi:MAG: DNA polymerase I [Thermoanaerobaculales bacterium]|nr:DNA polymerase I [Thermoanaerobaculales bacterium]
MSDPKRKSLYLVDGPNMAFRAFFAIRGMSNSQGLPTNALFGFASMVLKLVRDEQPDHLAIVWDHKGGSFRRRLYPDYKGTRPDMPHALREQMPWFQHLTKALDIPFLELEDYEADDLMGTLAHRWQTDLDVVLVTSDKDLMQLVGEHVTLLDTMKDRRIKTPDVFEKFGCEPSLVPDALGIWGDASDNIPGVKGIGEKGAKKLLDTWGGLDEIYRHIDEVEPKGIRSKLEADRENAYLSRDLATIRTDAPVDLGLDDLGLAWPPPEGPARELFTQLEFRSLLKEFGGEMQTVDRSGYRLVITEENLSGLAEELGRAKRFALDTETTGLDTMRAHLVGLSFCTDADSAWYVPVGHDGLDSTRQLSWDLVRSVLGPILENPDIGKTGQNLKFDLKILNRHGISVAGADGDTLLADTLLSPDRRSHRLDELALIHLGHKTIPFSEAVGGRDSFATVELENACRYAAEDAHVTWLLDSKLGKSLQEECLYDLYSEVEVPLMSVLTRMELRGIEVDRDKLMTLSVELGERIRAAEGQCHFYAGGPFNIGSVKQLREILFERLGLPVIRSTKTGPSTNEAVLTELAAEHALPRAILDYRSLVKLKNTYADPLPQLIHPETGRIHTTFSQTTTATGRLASTDPNLQNIPIRTQEGRRIRQAFIAPPGRRLLSADYSQVELRVLAHLCGGKGGFAEAFALGADIHTQTAAGLLGISPEEVTRSQRSLAKAVNFGIVYGQSAFGLAQTQGISRSEAASYIDRYKKKFPEIETFHKETLAFAKEHGYVRTMLGRRRPIDLEGGNFAQRRGAERMAVNTPVQGSAADLIKLAMIKVDRRLMDEFPGQYLLLQVHDELLLEVEEDQADAVSEMVRHEMSTAMDLSVPLEVDVGSGKTWDEAH